MEAKKKYFSGKFSRQDHVVYMLVEIITELQHLYKHERKAYLEERLNKVIKDKTDEDKGCKISPPDFEAISRSAEKLIRRDSNMTLSEVRSGVMRRNLKIACDKKAQYRDRIMADQLVINISGLDAKYTGGLEDDVTNELDEALTAIDEDAKQGSEEK